MSEDIFTEVVPLTEVKPHEEPNEPEVSKEERGQWNSQLAYILSVIGYSVGLGNVWRFPYICNRNGGGAFLIPFLVCLVLIGLPLFLLEVAVGQFTAKGPAHAWGLCPLVKGMGVGMLVLAWLMPIYHVVISAWSLYYAVFSCRAQLPWTSCNHTWNSQSCVTSISQLQTDSTPNMTMWNMTDHAQNITVSMDKPTFHYTATEEFWQYKALQVSDGLDTIGAFRWELALCHVGVWALLLLCVVKGVKSLGKAVYVTATLPYFILLVLLVRGLTLPGGPSGALYFLTPDFSKILTVQAWIEAAVQVFFSLGPTWGGLITMSSYNGFKAPCLRNTLFCTFWGEGTSLFAGVVVFSIIGFMAHEANVPISEVVSSGPGLAFVIYPEALSQLPLPQLWSFIFFVMLIVLAMDSIFSEIEAVLCSFLDQFPHLLPKRVLITTAYCAISCLLGLVFTTEGGVYIFQLSDWYCASLFPMMTGILECVAVGWIYGVGRFSDDIELMIGRPVPVFFKVSWCYITPAVLMVTFIFTLKQYTPPMYGSYAYPEYASILGWCLASLPLIPIVLVGVKVILSGDGSLVQKIKKSVQPDSSWRPSELEYRKGYHEKMGDRSEGLKEHFLDSFSCRK